MLTDKERLHYAFWSMPETVIRTQANAEAALKICKTCQGIAADLAYAVRWARSWKGHRDGKRD